LKNQKPEPETIKSVLKKITAQFQSAELEKPQLEAELILSQAIGIARPALYLEPGRVIDPSLIAGINSWTRERIERKPLSYIIGKAWFRELELEVNPAAMIPRPETELLVEEAIQLIKSDAGIKKILDLATGSGAIILSLAMELRKIRPDLEFFASDLSQPALELARKNAHRLRLEDQIDFRPGDLFQPFPQEKFHLIICNPPYIPENELPSLMPEVSRYEPQIALNGGKEGLDLIRSIILQAPAYLAPSGWLILELGSGQAGKLVKLEITGLKLQKLVKDFQGIDRIALFRR